MENPLTHYLELEGRFEQFQSLHFCRHRLPWGYPKTTVKNVGMKSTIFSALVETLFLVNRVEHQKTNRTRAKLQVICVFGAQLSLRQTAALISTNSTTIILHSWIIVNQLISTNQCLCLPKAETRFTRKKSVSAYAQKHVDLIPTFLTTQFLDSPQGSDVCSIEGKSPHNLFASMLPSEIWKIYYFNHSFVNIGRNPCKIRAPLFLEEGDMD